MPTIKEKVTSKELTSQLKKIEGEVVALSVDVKNKQKELQDKKIFADNLKQKIETLNKSNQEPVVSEHALLRYFERVENIDLKYIEGEILSEDVLKMISVLGGNGTYPNKRGFSVVMKNNVVVTIISDNNQTN